MWIHTQDSFRATSISIWLSCFFPLVKGRSFISAQYMLAASWMLKPWSARTTSPGNKWCNKPKFSVMYPFEMKPIVPWGVIPIRNFTVLYFLQLDQVWALAIRDVGLSINTSKQSITIAHFGNVLLNSAGIVLSNCSRSGQLTNTTNLWYKISSHLLKYVPQDWLTANLYTIS